MTDCCTVISHKKFSQALENTRLAIAGLEHHVQPSIEGLLLLSHVLNIIIIIIIIIIIQGLRLLTRSETIDLSC
jgi:hypothetical protein